MGKHTLKLAISAAIVALAGAAYWFGFRQDGLSSRLETFGLKTPFADFQIQRESRQTVKDLAVTEIHARQGESEVKLTVIEKGAASLERYADQRVFEINSQFNRGISPYPGAVSSESRCPKEFLPVVRPVSGAGWSGRKITTFANGRRQLGVCEENEARFDVQVLILACEKTGHLFEIQLQSPRPANALEPSQVNCL